MLDNSYLNTRKTLQMEKYLNATKEILRQSEANIKK